MTFHRKCLLVLAHVALALFAFTSSALADVPGTLTQQGRLLDSSGSPVPDAEVSFTFTIYDAAEDGNELWTETQDISTEDGFFSARLGEVSAFPPDLFDGSNALFLGVQVGSDDEMTPRQPITSVPFAMKSGSADHAATADEATHAATADTATNVTGDISPTSISTGTGNFSGALTVGGAVNVGGSQVINASGTWVGDIDFTSLVDLRTPTGPVATSTSNQCASGGLIVSGGCLASSGDWVQWSYPIAGKAGNSWSCGCGGTSCTVSAYAICLQ